MRALVIWSALLILVFSLGCQKRRQSNEERTLVNAYKLIDAQRTDEAITLLELELERMDPRAPQFITYKMALGSAYAHKAGVKVQRFSKMLKIGKIDIKFNNTIKVDDKKVSKPEAVDNFLKSFAKLIVDISKLTGVYTAIPTVHPDDEKYLVYSLSIMDSLPPERITPGDSLYRAVIRVIYLKHYLATRIFDDGVPVELEVESCQVNFDRINESLQRLTKTSELILTDLMQAQPKKAKSFKKRERKDCPCRL